MRVKNHAFYVLAVGMASALLLSGCPKKVDTAKGTATVEEEIGAPPPEPMEPMVEDLPEVVDKPMVTEPGIRNVSDIADVHFDYDMFNIRSDERAGLEEAAAFLTDNPGVKVKIEGHCDERGTNEYNLTLGERRAKSVKAFLVALGVSGSQISTISYGEERPSCIAANDSCYSQNRRGHFTKP